MTSNHDPAAVTAVLATLEATLRRSIDLAPDTQRRLQHLHGTLIAIEFKELEITVYIAIDDNGQLALSSYSEQTPTVTVRGTLESFAQLAAADDPGAQLINSDIEVRGNTAPLLELQAAVTAMEVDWEAPLVSALGDVVGHQVATSMRAMFAWGGNAARSLRRQLSEFILEEGRLSPPALELEDFYQQVHSLTLRVDRLESRSKRLAARIEELNE